ncbi:MAG TPA: hypothetical protein VMY43_10965 [Methanothrix sp.]|jgi:hypothetical protein|nr:hypothetical protein [Methanothrix sp.]
MVSFAANVDKRGLSDMARQVELGLTLTGEEAKEFLKNEKGSAFTAEQLAFFRQAKKIYKANCSKF